MNILDIIKNRRTIRVYKPKALRNIVVDKIIEAGMWAPSAHNTQPWKFVLIKNKPIIYKLIRILNNASERMSTGIKMAFIGSVRVLEKSQIVIPRLTDFRFKQFKLQCLPDYG